jgi:hypothetical protein
LALIAVVKSPYHSQCHFEIVSDNLRSEQLSLWSHSEAMTYLTDMKEETAEIVKSGAWLYDGRVTYEVWIVKQNFEYHYDEGFDESELLNANGEVFAVLYVRAAKVTLGSEFFSIDEAIAAAERVVPEGIQWDDHRLQPLFGGRKYQLSDRPKQQ